MNVAYIFHGHTRTWKDCHENFFKNVYSVKPGDIYIHTWDRTNSKVGSHWNGWQTKLDESLEELSSKIIDIKEIMSVYKPVHFIIETDPGIDHLQSIYNFNHHTAHLALKNYLNGQLKIFNTINDLGKKYDKYFFVRFDVDFLEKMEEDEFYSEELLVPMIPSGHGKLVFDIWKLGTFEQCKVVTNYAEQIDDWWYKQFNPDNFYELVLTQYYANNNVKLRESKTLFELRRLT